MVRDRLRGFDWRIKWMVETFNLYPDEPKSKSISDRVIIFILNLTVTVRLSCLSKLRQLTIDRHGFSLTS